MTKELINYGMDNNSNALGLNDLEGTFDDLGQLIAYLRNLSRQLVPLVDSLVPLSNNLNDLIDNLPYRIEQFLLHNPFFAISGVICISMFSGYILTGIIRNILEIKSVIK